MFFHFAKRKICQKQIILNERFVQNAINLKVLEP